MVQVKETLRQQSMYLYEYVEKYKPHVGKHFEGFVVYDSITRYDGVQFWLAGNLTYQQIHEFLRIFTGNGIAETVAIWDKTYGKRPNDNPNDYETHFRVDGRCRVMVGL